MYFKSFLKAIIVLMGMGCSDERHEAHNNGDFSLSCSRWGSSVIVCEGLIETDPISGYLKIWAYSSDPYFGDALTVCGGDLNVKTGNILHNYALEKETKDNLSCLDADDNGIVWTWSSENMLNITWEDIILDIEIPTCPYDDSHCAISGNGYIL